MIFYVNTVMSQKVPHLTFDIRYVVQTQIIKLKPEESENTSKVIMYLDVSIQCITTL